MGSRPPGGAGLAPGQQDGPEDPPLPAGPRRVGQPGLEHPGELTQQFRVLGVVEPQPGHAVAHPVAQQVDVAPGQVAVEVAEEPGDEGHEGVAVVVGAHRLDLVQPDGRRGQAEHVGAFQRAAHPPLGHDREDPGIDQPGHVAVQAGRGARRPVRRTGRWW